MAQRKIYMVMRKIFLLLLLSYTTHFIQAQFLRRIGNQVNNALSGNNNSDSSSLPRHHGKGNIVSNLRNSIGKDGGSHDSTLKLSKEDELSPTHADLSKFNPRHFYKLQAGEKFSSYEACLLTQADKLNPLILVIKDGRPWLIGNDGQHIAVDPKKIASCPLNRRREEVVPFSSLNGDRSEPYEDKPVIFCVKSPENGAGLNEMGFDKDALDKMQRSMDKGDTAAAFRQAMNMKKPAMKNLLDIKPRTTIVFRGKTFGPYMQVQSYVFSRGAGMFFAIVDFRRPNTDIASIKGDFNKLMEPWLIGSDGTRVKLPDGAVKIVADEDCGFIRIQVLKSVSDDIREVHASLFDPKTGKSIQIFNNEGLSAKPETEQSIEIRSGNLITKQHIGQETKLYLNDKWMTSLEGESNIPLSNVFISKDATRWAIWGSKALYFSNGEAVDAVIAVRLADQNGPSSLNWIVLANDNKTLEVCHYEL